jgi:hypothetical protein
LNSHVREKLRVEKLVTPVNVKPEPHGTKRNLAGLRRGFTSWVEKQFLGPEQSCRQRYHLQRPLLFWTGHNFLRSLLEICITVTNYWVMTALQVDHLWSYGIYDI